MAVGSAQEGNRGKALALFLRWPLSCPGWMHRSRPSSTRRVSGPSGWSGRHSSPNWHRATAKLVLVDAPAGFGKTTLVAQWRSSAAETRPFAWVSLDRGDSDPGRLWWYVVSALTRACPEIDGEAILAELRAQAPELPEVGAADAGERAGRAVGAGGPGARRLPRDQGPRLSRAGRVPAAPPAADRADRDHHEGRSAAAAGPPAGGRGDDRGAGPRAALHPRGGRGAAARRGRSPAQRA